MNGGKNVDIEAAVAAADRDRGRHRARRATTRRSPRAWRSSLLDGENTTARLGTASTGLTATGTITVKASHDGDFSAEAKSVAAGSTAVGVSIALNIVLNWNTLAEVARDVTGTSVEHQRRVRHEHRGARRRDDEGRRQGRQRTQRQKKSSDEAAQREITNNPNTPGNS